MNKQLKPSWTQLAIAARTILPVLILASASATSVLAQSQIASGTISGSGSGPYVYNLTFSDALAAGSPIGSVWYSWIPGQFFLPGIPTSASAPAGWTATVSANSVQYVANSSAFYIQPGQSRSGFGYQGSFSPAQLAAASNSGLSVAYSAGLFSDAGDTFTVQAVPEPASSLTAVGALLFLGLCSAKKSRRTSAQ